MPTARKPVSINPELNEIRFTLPPELLRVFQAEPRVLIKWRPDGLWPIDPGILNRINFEELFKNEEFNKNFEVLIVPRA